tara:strand:+ start:136 stop:1116 length:981 start_codon:yes stop_codon:yes gene_type:complete
MLFSNKKILIFGGLGFIGSNLCQTLLSEGAIVTIYDSCAKDTGYNFRNIKEIRKNIKFVRKDIRNLKDVSKEVKKNEIIINCAASTSHNLSMIKPFENIFVNVIGTLNILESIRMHNKYARFIHLSTSTQIGNLKNDIADENHPEFPKDVYSVNKMSSEKLSLIYANNYSLRVTVLRLANVFGPRAAIHSSNFTFNNYFIGQALQGNPLTVYKPGKQKRNLIFIKDLIEGIMICIKKEKTIGQVYFLVSDTHMSVLQIAQNIVKVIGGKLNYINWPPHRKTIEIGDSILSNLKFKNDTKWIQKTQFIEGLLQCKKYYSDKMKYYIK